MFVRRMFVPAVLQDKQEPLTTCSGRGAALGLSQGDGARGAAAAARGRRAAAGRVGSVAGGPSAGHTRRSGSGRCRRGRAPAPSGLSLGTGGLPRGLTSSSPLLSWLASVDSPPL